LPTTLALDRELPLRGRCGFWARLPMGLVMGDGALGLRTWRDVPVRLLSSGQASARRWRGCRVGRALWLLDEPLNGLDADGVERLDAAIAAHRAAGGACSPPRTCRSAGRLARLELGG
jgi:heme exporter protein A